MEVITEADRLLEGFKREFSDRLGKRENGFQCAIEHLAEQDAFFTIIETGTARKAGNWDGDGQSTLIWDWLSQNFSNVSSYGGVLSIDIDADGIKEAESQTKRVSYKEGDSLMVLQEIVNDSRVEGCKLLYLDSWDWDWNRNLEVALHHMFELAILYARLPKGCMIMVDDCHTQDLGKHAVIRQFFEKLGKRPVFEAYQTAWIK